MLHTGLPNPLTLRMCLSSLMYNISHCICVTSDDMYSIHTVYMWLFLPAPNIYLGRSEDRTRKGAAALHEKPQ